MYKSTTVFLSLLILFSIFSFSLTSAALRDYVNSSNGSASVGGNIETIKATVVQFIDKRIQVLENFKLSKVENASIDESDKELINGIVDGMISRLEQYRSDVEATTTVEELRTVRKQLAQETLNSRNEIRKAVNELRKALNDETIAKVDKAVEAMNAQIDEAQANCPQQKAQIDIAQASINSAIENLKQVNQMVLNQADPELVSTKLYQASKDLDNAYYVLETALPTCVYYIDP